MLTDLKSALVKRISQLWHSLVCGCHREEHAQCWRGYARLIYPLMSAVALGWFLCRVIPKPIRATYPCQQAAFPVASAFVIWVLGLKTGLLAWLASRERWDRFRPAVRFYLLAGLVWIATQTVMGFILSGGGSSPSVTAASSWIPGDPPNAPVGQAQGIFPGRVTWIRDTNATPWRGPGHGYWWHNTNINQTPLDRMVSRSLRGLSGATNDSQAWDRLFRYYNTNHARGDYGYRTNEAIAIKVNLNNCYSGYSDADNNMDASPHAVLAILRQLVNQAGVPQGKITIYDATRAISDRIYNPGHAEFPNVHWVDSQGLNGREAPSWVAGAISYTSASTACGTRLPLCVVNATYLINFALLKGHEISGITLCGKNHFGSIESPGNDHGKYVKPSAQPMGSYSAYVDFMGSPNLGAKTMLNILDGLYGDQTNVRDATEEFCRWPSLFGGQWSASFFMSLDPVAIDSVGLDFLRSEFGNKLGYSGVSTPGAITNCDNYLHEAARGTNSVVGAYRPNGVVMGSAGVHEHWNNATERKYSRNLNLAANGIELVALHEAVSVSLVSPHSGQTFPSGAPIALQTAFNVSDDRIARVEFFRNGQAIGAISNAPWAILWTNAPAGIMVLDAIATDSEGNRFVSAGASISVWQTDLQVALTSPISGSAAPAGANVSLAATASSTRTTVTNVSFLRNGVSLGSIKTAPFQTTWSNVPVGMYSLTAVATGADGLSVTSAVSVLTVKPASPVTAGTLYVDLRASGFSGGGTIWTNRGTLGQFARYGNPAPAADVAGTGIPGVVFNGIGDAFTGPASVTDIDGAGSRSIEAWVFNPTVEVEETMVNIGQRGTDARNCAFNFGSHLTWGACAQWGAYDIGWNNATNVPAAGAWHHLVYTYDGATTCNIYVDGALRVTKTLAGALNTFAGEPILLGAQRGTTAGSVPSLFWFSGALNSVRIHGGVLSAAQVAVNYAYGPETTSGAVVITTQPTNTTAMIGGGARFNGATTGTVPIRYQWLCNGAAIAGATNNTLALLDVAWPDDGALFQLVASNWFNLMPYATTSAPARLAVLSAGDALIHRYSFTSNANDSIGAAHGTLQGTAALSGGRVNLNGTSGTYVNLPGGLIADCPAVTFETWCTLGVNANWVRLFDMGSTNGNNGQYDLYFCPHSGAGDYRLTVMDPHPSERIANFAGNLDNQTSLHLVCVLDAATGFMGVYANGEFVTARWDLTSLDSVATNLFFLGRSLFAWDGWLNGSIDEFRIYKGALGAGQITRNFSNGPNAIPAKSVKFLSIPQSRTNFVGTAASFSATVNDCEPAAFNWWRSGNPLAGQTNLTLEMAAVQPGDDGEYFIMVSNSVHTVTSPPARLSVLPLPRLDAANSSASAYGNTLMLSWSAAHTGWRLQVQTNNLAAGLGTNWFDVPGSTATNRMSLPMDPLNGSVFYRLIFP